MPSKVATNRPDIVKKIAGDLQLTQAQTEKIILEFEKQIARFLREREQVRIHSFGRFIVTTRKSRTIKQVNTQIPRLLLESQSIQFKINPNFKEIIHGRTPKRRAVTDKTSVAVEYKPKIVINKTPPPTPQIAEKDKIKFKPLSILPRVETDKIREQIKQRILKINDAPKPAPVANVVAPEVKVFASLLKQIKRIGLNSINFTYSDRETIEIFADKPRKQISHLPQIIVKRFLDNIEVHNLNIPQERFLSLAFDKEKYDKMFLEVHSLPTETGASVKISIK